MQRVEETGRAVEGGIGQEVGVRRWLTILKGAWERKEGKRGKCRREKPDRRGLPHPLMAM